MTVRPRSLGAPVPRAGVCWSSGWWVAVSARGWDQPESLDAGGEQLGPGRVGGQVQAPGAAVVGDPGWDGEQPEPESFGFPPSRRVMGEGEHLPARR